MASLATLTRALGSLLADVLAPRGCAACDAPLVRHAVFCPPCARGVIQAPSLATEAGLSTSAFAVFGGPVATALRRLKYEARPDLATPLGHLARARVRGDRLAASLVVPVPLHPKRLAERGYNQAALLGAEVATELGAPLGCQILERVRDTPQQARLDGKERRTNVVGAFRVRAAYRIRGQDVVLVDDVATTGSTLQACAASLWDVGAASVTAVVVARAPAC